MTHRLSSPPEPSPSTPHQRPGLTVPADFDPALAPPKFVSDWVDRLLTEAINCRASDIHLNPEAQSLHVLWRLDGLLAPVTTFPKALAPNVIARLKVLSELLTYHTEVPQEGRLRHGPADVEMRFSTFPTIYGERGVVRLFIGSRQYRYPEDLGLPADLQRQFSDLLRETAGVLLMTGPAGSGKTTTAYAALRALQAEHGSSKSLLTIEDPVEGVLEGVTQAQVHRAAGFDYAVGVRSLMRQDPDGILVGEIRDRETAETVFQAGLTGHLVLSTYHAGSAAEAVSRLSEMGIEPYLLRSGLLGILCQRLVRRLCACAVWSDDDTEKLGLNVSRTRLELGCPACSGSGYSGRMLLAELLLPHGQALTNAILNRVGAGEIRAQAIRSGMISLTQRGLDAVESGQTSAREFRRVLGFRPWEAAT